MREISSIMGGMGLLIFGFLVLNNYTGATSILTGVSSSGVNLITALQGRGNAA